MRMAGLVAAAIVIVIGAMYEIGVFSKILFS